MEFWFSELQTPNVKLSIRVDRQLYSGKIEFQRIDVFESPEFGRFLTLDGYMMLTEKDEFIYHEMITHVPMAVHPNVKKVLVIGAGDGGVVRELTRYQEIEQIDLVEIEMCIRDRERPIHDIFVAGEKFSSLKEKTLTLRELAAQPLIMLEEKANSRLYVQRFFLRKGIELNPEIELASYELMGELARINLGLSCMVREFCAEELRQKKVFEVNLAEPIPELCIRDRSKSNSKY